VLLWVSVLLPVGLLYGRVLPLAVADFVAAGDRDEVVPALLRGRVGFAPIVQAAMAFVYDHLAVRRARDVTLISAEKVADGRAVVRLNGPHGPLAVSVVVERHEVVGLTCANRGPGSYLAYRAISAQPG